MVGIVSYGTYIPRARIAIAEIAGAWKKEPSEVTGSLGVLEKAVPAADEDAVTIALEAARRAVGAKRDIDVVFVGSESHPYAVNPTSTTVGELLGLGHNYLAADLQFACKAATTGMQAIAGLLEAGQIAKGLVIGADTAQSKPHDSLEYTSGAGGAAFVMGRDRVIARLVGYTSYSSDTPDFWRRDGIRYPSHAGRFTGEPAYYAHVMGAATRLLTNLKKKPSDFDWCVFHMPNGKFPVDVAKRLGFTKEQLAPSLIVRDIGNPYSASALMGLAATLDVSKPGQNILMVSYGSGAGSDAFMFKTTDALTKPKETVRDQIAQKTYINYVQYLKQTHKI